MQGNSGSRGFLALETDMPHPEYEEQEERMITESIHYLKEVGASVG